MSTNAGRLVDLVDRILPPLITSIFFVSWEAVTSLELKRNWEIFAPENRNNALQNAAELPENVETFDQWSKLQSETS